MLSLLELLVWLLPSGRPKNALLRRFGHRISANASIGPILVLNVRRFEIGQNVKVGPFNVFRGLSLVRLDNYVMINSWNWISAVSHFQDVNPKAGTLHMEYAAGITSRHYLDASGTIIMKPHSRLGGGRTYIQTHEPDFDNNLLRVGTVVIGYHSLVCTCAVMLAGAQLPDQSLLAANSTMLASRDGELRPGLYAGSPAIWRRECSDRAFFSATGDLPGSEGHHYLTEAVFEGTMGPSTAVDPNVKGFAAIPQPGA